MQIRLPRVLVYALGLVVLALGIVLNAKTGLGTAPLVSIAYCVSRLTPFAFADLSFVFYSAFVVVEIILHLVRFDRARLVNDVLQLPFALVFTRFMGLFDRLIPNLAADLPGTVWATMGMRLATLAAAIILIGLGVCLTVRMRLIPNPGDGVVLAISDFTGWKLGLTKNLFDLVNVLVACAIGLIARGQIIGVGIGTALTILGVGRVVDLAGRVLAPLIDPLAPKPADTGR